MNRLSRRRCLLQIAGAGATLAAGWSLPAASAWAGAQQEEQLSDAVRTALSAQIAEAPPPQPHFRDDAHRAQYRVWLLLESNWLLRRMPDQIVRELFLRTLWYESRRAGLEPALILGLIQVESGFNKYAISPAGAMGYMQVMPFWTRQIGNGDIMSLFHMQVNLRYGCVILRHYLNIENGNLFYALGRYNGSRGRAAYPDAVLAARKRWRVADGSG
ncbi:MAG: lytic transglycosylase domain-containing protein [Thiomonas sp.]|uniref:lytic transglycosylase domain-containing protein n=1 Tax=Thiomonas sp. TaxID=2047785 RepID=UPI002A371779|nr:lytic transglycosylase domain-containing protein [Thiomonas sp.]MDY0330531.1 lytic transglycosylase domain-containing protein [Thiomonas sp.]